MPPVDPKHDYLWYFPAISTLAIGAIILNTTHTNIFWFGVLCIAGLWFFSVWLSRR